jgi:glycosyltransferase involved in cell wall biosynthesis
VLFPLADLVIASSVPMQKDLDRLLRGRSCVVTLPNPVDVEALRRQAAAVPALGPEIDPATPPAKPGVGRRFIAVSRLIPRKGIDELLEAFATAAGPEDHLDIVGDGPLREALEALAARLALGPRVQFLGHLDAPASRVADADLLVQASRFEGMPNAVLEALAVGTPVLATTDLTMLAEVASTTKSSAIRLVARAELATALAESTALPGPIPRPSLLPEEFGRDRVATELLRLLDAECA